VRAASEVRVAEYDLSGDKIDATMVEPCRDDRQRCRALDETGGQPMRQLDCVPRYVSAVKYPQIDESRASPIMPRL
jgi:hypothetical protein